MQYTTNYNLKKPEGSDPVNIQDFNDNADSLDTELKKRVIAAGGDISNTKIVTADSIATEFPVPAAGDTPKTFLGKMKKFVEDFKNIKTGLLTVGMLVNNCVTNNANLPLSAAQGKVLMDLYTQLNGELCYRFTSNVSESPMDTFKKNWSALPELKTSIGAVANINFAAGFIVYKHSANYGAVYMFSYSDAYPVPMFARLVNGTWISP